MRIVRLVFDGFDWDQGNWDKIERRFPAKIVEEFFKRPVLVKRDTRHSNDEPRFIAVGQIESGRKLLVAFTMRRRMEELLVRPISARYMHKKEERAYEKQIKELEDE